MRRPSFQFYAYDWQGNSNLKRCTHAEKGAWIDVMCLLHDQAEYGALRWPLKEIAQAVGAPLALLRGLAAKGVLKGDDKRLDEPLVYVPRSGRRNGDPVTLMQAQDGPIWFSSRMVVDEYIRSHAGASTRFKRQDDIAESDTLPGLSASPSHSPSRRHGEWQGEYQGDGPSTSSSSTSSPTDKYRKERSSFLTASAPPAGGTLDDPPPDDEPWPGAAEQASAMAAVLPPQTELLPAEGKTDDDKRKTADRRGSRLKADWQPDQSLLALASGLGLNPEWELDQFRDYWAARTGKDASKLDWSAAFRTWCRNAHKWAEERRGGGAAGGGARSQQPGNREESRGILASAARVISSFEMGRQVGDPAGVPPADPDLDG